EAQRLVRAPARPRDDGRLRSGGKRAKRRPCRRAAVGQGQDGEPAQRAIAPDADGAGAPRTHDRAVRLTGGSTLAQLVETDQARLAKTHAVPAERDTDIRGSVAEPMNSDVRRRARDRERSH